MQCESQISSLLVRARNGDQRAFHQMIDGLRPRIRSWPWMVDYLNPSVDASDFAQELLLVLWKELPDLRSDGIPQLLCWLKTTSQRLVKDSAAKARAQKRDRRRECGSASKEAGGATTPATAAGRADFLRRVADFEVGLPPLELAVFRRKVWGGESFEKIGVDLGVGKTAAYRTFHQILVQLRTSLGGASEDWL